MRHLSSQLQHQRRETNLTTCELIGRGNSMLRLCLAAVSAVVVANVIVAIATTTKRGPSRFWWLSPRFLERSPDRESKMGFRDRYILTTTYMRRTFSFLFASALLLA